MTLNSTILGKNDSLFPIVIIRVLGFFLLLISLCVSHAFLISAANHVLQSKSNIYASLMQMFSIP